VRSSGGVVDKPGPLSADVNLVEVLLVPAPVAFLPLGSFAAVNTFICSFGSTHWMTFDFCPPFLLLLFPFAPPLATSLLFLPPSILVNPLSLV
jgi:hypothetical protein